MSGMMVAGHASGCTTTRGERDEKGLRGGPVESEADDIACDFGYDNTQAQCPSGGRHCGYPYKKSLLKGEMDKYAPPDEATSLGGKMEGGPPGRQGLAP